ncbi:MAG: type II toxin-antitoxin system VapC family toxin [Thermoleophilia bacterium]|nr:type II toxin-antitoxin system VapC family toxin [Thermoleophilia bacterium]
MRVRDSSALVPLCVDEPRTFRVRGLLDEDPGMAVRWGSIVECWSALSRRRREGQFSLAHEEAARAILATLARAWIEILPADGVRSAAGRILRVRPPRTADAPQLAAALTWAPPARMPGETLTFDKRLRDAARTEGLAPV